MKKVLFLLLTLILIAPSCKKEEQPATIEGKWHLYKSAVVSGPEDNRTRIERDQNLYYEFSAGTVKITENGETSELDYTFDQAENTLKIGYLTYFVDTFKAKEMVLRIDGITFTVIDGNLVKLVEENYNYFRKE